jgi:hypothetical protein
LHGFLSKLSNRAQIKNDPKVVSQGNFLYFLSASEIDYTFEEQEGQTLWPSHLACHFSGLNLSLAHQSASVDLHICPDLRDATKTVILCHSPVLEFIPVDQLKQFPNLNGFSILGTPIPIFKYDLFKGDFQMIQHLLLVNCQITEVQEDAFIDLPNLFWISLGDNQLTEMRYKIFHSNVKLQYIDLTGNRIDAVHPDLLRNLPDLKYCRLDKDLFAGRSEYEFTKILTNNYVKKYGLPDMEHTDDSSGSAGIDISTLSM